MGLEGRISRPKGAVSLPIRCPPAGTARRLVQTAPDTAERRASRLTPETWKPIDGISREAVTERSVRVSVRLGKGRRRRFPPAAISSGRSRRQSDARLSSVSQSLCRRHLDADPSPTKTRVSAMPRAISDARIRTAIRSVVDAVPHTLQLRSGQLRGFDNIPGQHCILLA